MSKQALGYYRTSSAANCEGDSPYRQNDRVMGFAAQAGFEVVACYWDAAVSGADPVEARLGFAALFDHAVTTGIGAVIVEDASRFARSMVAQELGADLLTKHGIKLFTAAGVEITDPDPDKIMYRQIVGAFVQNEKAKVVAKLRHGRDRIRAQGLKCEGRKSHGELNPELARQARSLASPGPTGGSGLSLRQIAAELASRGFCGASGKPLAPTVVRKLVRG